MASGAKGAVERHGRRAIPKVRRTTSSEPRPERIQLTVGDLVAAAYDALGNDTQRVIRVLSSPEMANALGAKIVFE